MRSSQGQRDSCTRLLMGLKFARSFIRHHDGRFSRRVGYNPYTELEFEQTGSESDDSDSSDSSIMASGLRNIPANELFTIEKIWAKRDINSAPFLFGSMGWVH